MREGKRERENRGETESMRGSETEWDRKSAAEIKRETERVRER